MPKLSPRARVRNFFKNWLVRGTTTKIEQEGMEPRRASFTPFSRYPEFRAPSVKTFGIMPDQQVSVPKALLETWLDTSKSFASAHARKAGGKPALFAIDRSVLSEMMHAPGTPDAREILVFGHIPPHKIIKLFEFATTSYNLSSEDVRNFLSALFTKKEIARMKDRFSERKGLLRKRSINIEKLVSVIKAGLVLKNTQLALTALAEEHGLEKETWENSLNKLRQKYGSRFEAEINRMVFESDDNKRLHFVDEQGRIL